MPGRRILLLTALCSACAHPRSAAPELAQACEPEHDRDEGAPDQRVAVDPGPREVTIHGLGSTTIELAQAGASPQSVELAEDGSVVLILAIEPRVGDHSREDVAWEPPRARTLVWARAGAVSHYPFPRGRQLVAALALDDDPEPELLVRRERGSNEDRRSILDWHHDHWSEVACPTRR
ncbi:MAG: hypothetical protein HC927_05085 [Deltaproteobacteria bacterium]|nr:hypothetical protein [Deltaproteobacteria bacterium]